MSGPDQAPQARGAVDEFDLIARLMRPLAQGAPEALNLADDAAVLGARPGQDLVVSADMMVEGVHFLPSDPMADVARKLLRVNLSDLAAKGAEPHGYFLSIAWPTRCGWAEREAFANGLGEDQATFGVTLLGGDTTAISGPLTANVTIVGYTPERGTVLRSGARPGDVVLVSGAIGDGWLGLQAALAGVQSPALARYRLPEPRLGLRPVLRQFARAAADVSDGLIADAGHIAEASGLKLELDLDRVPLSPEGRAHVDRAASRADAWLELASGGDDYEIVLCAAPASVEAAMALANATGVPLTPVGRMAEGQGTKVLFQGREIRVERAGYRHR